MTKQSAIRTGSSLLERAAEIYDFSSGMLIAPAPEPGPEPAPRPARPAVQEPASRPASAASRASASAPAPEPAPPARRSVSRGRVVEIDRDRLRKAALILPEAPVSGLAEELRLIKRQLLATVSADPKSRSILVCSAQPDEGKTFCAVNLALSLASERDLDVLLVDGDFPKPEIMSMLGVEAGPGLVDALADPRADAEEFVIRTDLGGLSLLPAGRQANNVPELLASERTRDVLAGLAAADPRRILIFDSPPVLMASSATVLASHVGQALVVVRADRTTETDLKEAIGLLSPCGRIALVLNGAGFAAGGNRFGRYYGNLP